MIEFRLDQRSGVPTYLQLVQQVRQALRLGILQPGDQLPTVKEVVGKLEVLLKEGDLLITMGAGDVVRIGESYLAGGVIG